MTGRWTGHQPPAAKRTLAGFILRNGKKCDNRDRSERKAAEARLQAALAEIGRLKERLEKENRYLQDEIKHTHGLETIVGPSTPLRGTRHNFPTLPGRGRESSSGKPLFSLATAQK